MIKGILFDIDGVLLDSFEANLKFFQDVLERGGYPRPNRRAFRNTFHLTFLDTIRHFTRTESEEELQRFRTLAENTHYSDDLLDLPEGAHEVIKTLSETYKLGVVSSRRKQSMEHYFDYAKNRHLFHTTVCYEDCVNHKPHPEPLLLAASRLKSSPGECVYVGDAHTDIEAGKAAGMKTILYGTKKNKDASAATASFRQLSTLIKRL